MNTTYQDFQISDNYLAACCNLKLMAIREIDEAVQHERFEELHELLDIARDLGATESDIRMALTRKPNLKNKKSIAGR